MRKCILIVGFIIIITSCFCLWAKSSSSDFTHGQNNQLLQFVNELNAKRPDLVQPSNYLKTVKDKIHFPKNYYKAITEEEAILLMTRRPKLSTVSVEKACEDIDLFFRMLQYMMGRYDILGGEPVFNAAKDRIMQEIKDTKAKNISTIVLENIMVRNLDFVTDNHFMVGNHEVFYENNSDTMRYQTFMSDIYFGKDGKGYFLLDSSKDKNYFVSCNNRNVQMVPYLSNDGSIIYTLVQYITPKEKTYSDVIYMANGTILVTWNEVKESSIQHLDVYKEYDNLAYIDLININTEETENMLKSIGKKAKKKDVVILDLRFNGGIHGYNFLETFLGEKESIAEVAYERKTMLSDSTILYGQEQEVFTSVASTGRISDNKVLVVVLVDNKTACASEDFAMHCRFANNTIIVGTNTRGHLDGGFYGVTDQNFDDKKYDILFKYLPNSGITVRVDNAVSYYGDYEDMVGKGFFPDLYVSDTGLSLEPVLNMLIKNNVISEDTANKLLIDRLGRKMGFAAASTPSTQTASKSSEQKPVYSHSCTCGNTSFVFENPHYKCTVCGQITDHEKMMDACSGVWKWQIGNDDFTLSMGKYDSPFKTLYVNKETHDSSSSGNWYLERDDYACLEFIAFDKNINVIFFKTINQDSIICDFTWNGKKYVDITIKKL